MRKKIAKVGIALIAAMVALTFAGCPQDADDETPSGAAELTTKVKLGAFEADKIPTPITRAEWLAAGDDLADYNGADYYATIIVPQISDLTGSLTVNASGGASIKYAVSTTLTDKPTTVFAAQPPAGFTNNQVLNIQITSEDGKKVVYYRVQLKLANSVSSLSQVTVAGVVAAPLGTPGSTWNDAGIALGLVGINNSQRTNAQVMVTKTAPSSTAQFARVAALNDSAAPNFSSSDTITFEDGDFLYIEVTAQDGISKSVYKIEVAIGRTATASEIKIGTQTVSNLGTPAATVNEAGLAAGTVLLKETGSTNFSITVTPTDSEVTDIKYAVVQGSATPTFGTSTTLTLTEEDFLYVQLTSTSTTNPVTLVYKIQVFLSKAAAIKYGHPEIQSSVNHFIDPAWNDTTLEEYAITRIFPGDSPGVTNSTTHGVAKAMWDEDGLYVYVDVTDPTVSANPQTSPDHTKDSVELFINEDGNTTSVNISQPYAGRGSQFRVGAHGETSADSVLQVSGWKKDNNSGYVVIFQAPWRYLPDFPLTNGKKFGLDLQINACATDGGREAVVAWNNNAHGNYQNITDYAVATLDLAGETMKVNAKDPVITTSPEGKLYAPPLPSAADPLTVAATSRDGGTLSYKWYSNTTISYTGGTEISGAITASYTPTLPSIDGVTYYWVEVTNTLSDNGDGGRKIASVNSAIASVRVSSVPLYEKVQAGSCGVPVYRFTPPAGTPWSAYKKMTYTVYIQAGSETLTFTNNEIRSHIVGNFQPSVFNSQGEYYTGSSWGPQRWLIIANNVGISSIVGSDYVGGTWKTLTYDLSPDDVDHDPALKLTAGDTGPWYLGIGFTINETNASGKRVVYWVKDVALVKENGDKLYADDLQTPLGSRTLGQLRVRYQGGDGVTRSSLEPLP
jgi:hypothetical protein